MMEALPRNKAPIGKHVDVLPVVVRSHHCRTLLAHFHVQDFFSAMVQRLNPERPIPVSDLDLFIKLELGLNFG